MFSQAERHSLSHAVIRATWRACHRLPRPGALTLAGPVSFLVVVAELGGHARVRLGTAVPALDARRLPAAGKLDGPGASLRDSLYFSPVALATLGYRDISSSEGWLRVVAPLESLLGLGLLITSVSWLLSIFRVLPRRASCPRYLAGLAVVRFLTAALRHDDESQDADPAHVTRQERPGQGLPVLSE